MDQNIIGLYTNGISFNKNNHPHENGDTSPVTAQQVKATGLSHTSSVTRRVLCVLFVLEMEKHRIHTSVD